MYEATKLLDKNGKLAFSNRDELKAEILKSEAMANGARHEAKLIRIEIGIAITQVASADGVGLTETIANLDLCRNYDRHEKTFLSYCRVGLDPELIRLANDPTVSFSVLDEIASSKKPRDPLQKREFTRRICNEIRETGRAYRKEEGLPEDATGKLRTPPVTRRVAVGMIRQTQIEFGVPTKAVTPAGANKDRADIKNRKNLARIGRLVRLSNCAAILLMREADRRTWLAEHGLTETDVIKAYSATRGKLADDGVIKATVEDLSAFNIVPELGLLRYEKEVEDEIPQPKDEEEAA